ncbi:hypothetical protein NDU88_002944 [Pleurodeles waltl]|uniref:Uncharacterized protein n=1 Tax=Pleurodeles waltl TaxID=8319 RepID=A0AAV7MQW3_PLEWA|nr:hypothetical protein NDU88_002944 [Pleurodeles waltl]
MTDPEQVTNMDYILQEIKAVSRRLEDMDTAIPSLTMETKSMRLDIAGFQPRVTGLEHRMATMEDHVHTVLDKDQELLFLCSKLTDLENRSRRDNIRVFGFHLPSFRPPKNDQNSLRPAIGIPEGTSLGTKRKDRTSKLRPNIACLLKHGQPVNSS